MGVSKNGQCLAENDNGNMMNNRRIWGYQLSSMEGLLFESSKCESPHQSTYAVGFSRIIIRIRIITNNPKDLPLDSMAFFSGAAAGFTTGAQLHPGWSYIRPRRFSWSGTGASGWKSVEIYICRRGWTPRINHTYIREHVVYRTNMIVHEMQKRQTTYRAICGFQKTDSSRATLCATSTSQFSPRGRVL